MGFNIIIPEGAKTTPAVEAIGYTKDIENSSFGPGLRKGYTIHFNIKGLGYFNGKPVKAGQGFLVFDGAYAHHYTDKSDPWELVWITLSDEEVSKQLFLQYNTNKKTGIFDFHSSVYLRELVKKICEARFIAADSLYMLNLFLQIHFNCMDYSTDTLLHRDSEIYLNSAVKYIKSNIHRNLKVEELTDLIGITQPYLYKLFMEKFKYSPKQYILKLKLDTAKELLLKSNMTITEIANSVGFPDVLAFSKFFSQKENLSPSAYRLNKK